MSTYSSYSDNYLVQLLAADDRGAFTEIYTRYWKYIYAIAYKYSQDKQSSEEIVQEVFLKIWERRTEVRINDLSAYLGTAGKFSILHELQKNYRRKQILDGIPISDTDITPQQKVDAIFLKEYLDGIVDRLPAKCRLIYRLSREQHLSNNEIAEKLDISPKTVESHLTRALGSLKTALQDSSIATIFIITLFKS